MTPARPLALLLGAVLAGGLLTGCGGVDEALTVDAGTADVSGLYAEPAPELPVALTTPGQYLSNDFYDFGGPVEARTDGDVTVVVRFEHLTAYDPGTHEERWRLRVPESVCDSTGVVGGRIALLTDRRGLEGCRQVTLVDARDGSVLWRRDTREDGYVANPGVALTRSEVLVVGECGVVRRFATDGGDALDPLGDGDDCGDSAAVDDGVVATTRELDGDRDGFDLEVTDPATGRSVSRRTVGPDDGGVNRVITSDPLVMEVQEDGYRSLQRFDDQGRRVGFLGRSFDPYGHDTDARVAARVGDLVVLSYKDLPGYRAHDLSTGDEVWATDDLRFLAGADGRGLVWVQPVEVLGEDGSPAYQQQVTRTPVDDPSAGELLGAPGKVDSAAVAGDDLLVDDGSGVDVVPLPAEGLGPAPAPGPSTLDTSAVANPDRQDGDALPSDVADPCAGIGADTLAAIGLRTDVPAPATCRWDVYTLARPGEVSLDVTARAVGPGELPDSELVDPDPEVEEAASTATGAAAQIFAGQARRWDGFEGLGDEARTTSRTNATGTRSTARIRVRSGNVIVEVDGQVSGPVGPGDRPVPLDVLEAAVREAAQDVLDTTLG